MEALSQDSPMLSIKGVFQMMTPRLTHAVHQGGLPDDDFDLTTGSECENDNEGAGGNRMKTIDEVLDEELEQEVLPIHKPELFWIHMLTIP